MVQDIVATAGFTGIVVGIAGIAWFPLVLFVLILITIHRII